MSTTQKIILCILAGWLVACTRPAKPRAQQHATTPVPTATWLTAATVPIPGASPVEDARWQMYPSYNTVRGLAFAPDGALWAAIAGGVVRWDLRDDTPTYYPLPGDPPANQTHQIAITEEGIVWVATLQGVARLDSARAGAADAWRVYTVDDGLPSNAAYALTLTADAVWTGTQRGPARMETDASQWSIHRAMQGIKSAGIAAIAGGEGGTLWATTYGSGVIRYDPESDTWATVNETLPQPANARTLAVAPDGAPWVHVGYDNVYRFDGTTWQMGYEATPGRWVCDIAFGAELMPYIATCDGYQTYGTGLAYWEGTQWSYVTTEDGLVSNALTAVALAPDGTLAVGSDEGISVRQDGHWRTLRHGPARQSITTLAVAPDGGVWLGFGTRDLSPEEGGVTRLAPDGQWQYFDESAFPEGGNVQTLSIAPSGDVWAGTGCGIARLSECCDAESRWQTVVPCDGRILGDIHAIAFARDGSAWVASDYNVYQIVGEDLIPHADKLPSALAVAKDGRVWLGHITADGGDVSVFDGQTWAPQPSTSLSTIRALGIADDGSVWVSGRAGVLRLDGGQWISQATTPDEEAVINTLFTAPDGQMWGITSHSLVFWENNAMRTITPPYTITLHSGAFAADGSLWLGTDFGVIRFRE